MTNFELLAFLFVGFLAAIVFGIFLGLAIADRRKQQPHAVKPNPRLERFRESAFARTDGRRGNNILDADVIE